MYSTRRIGTLAFLHLLVFARPAGAQWGSNGNGVCVFSGEQSYPATTTDGAGGAFVVWVDYRLGGSDLYLQRITSTGAIAAGWTANGIALCTAANDQRTPAIAADGSGGAFVTWEDDRAGYTDPNIYLQRVTAAGTLATGWSAGGLAICSAGLTQAHPSLAVESGAAIVAWEDDRDAVSTNIYAQKVSGAGVVQWAADGVPVCAAASSQTVPSTVGDKAGGAIVAWQDPRGGLSDIYAQRINASGVAQWTADGVGLCVAANDQLDPRAMADASGGAIVAWDDYRSNNSDIYAQRVNASGVSQWTSGGVALCSDPGEQYGGVPVSDGAGGAIVPWDDFRNGPGNLYAQKITAGGTLSWTANGLAVCAVGDISDPVAAPDGIGGAFFVWDDARGGQSLDLYAVRLTSAGALGSGWAAGGTLICNAANNQLRPVVTSDGTGSVIASWFDERNGNYDIYSKRLAMGGGAVDVPLSASASISLLAAPNPMRASTALRFSMAVAEPVRLEVLDVTGRVVRLLLAGESLPAGSPVVAWDGRDDSGSQAPTGLYLIRLSTPSRTEIRKLTRLQ